MCFLVGTLPDGTPFRHELTAGRTTVGRFALSTIRLEEESISPLHAELIALGSQRFLLRDLHSQHGIAVNGHEVFEEEITAPCQLSFGRLTCTLEAEAAVEEAGAPAPLADPAARQPKAEFHSIRPPVTTPRAKGRATTPQPTASSAAAGSGAPVQIHLPKPPRPPAQAKPRAAQGTEAKPAQPGPPPAPERPLAETVDAVPRGPRSPRAGGRRLVLGAAVLLAAVATGLYLESQQAGARQEPSLLSRLLGRQETASLAPRRGFLTNLPPTPPHTAESIAASRDASGLAKIPVPPPSPTPIGTARPTDSPPPEPTSQATPAPSVAPPLVAAALPEPATAHDAERPSSAAEPSAPTAPTPEAPPNAARTGTPLAAPEISTAAEPGEPGMVAENSPVAPPSPEPASLPPAELPVPPPPALDPVPDPVPPFPVKVSGEVATAHPETPTMEPLPQEGSIRPEQTDAASLVAPGQETRGKWRLVSAARNPRWDASAGALLASNDWKMNARQLMEAGATPDDAPSRVASWYFSSTQPEETGELARLSTKPEISTSPPTPAPVAVTPEKVGVMILGDSLALCGFGSRLDHLFRAAPNVKSTNTYMACGTVPMSWLKEGIFANLKTYCGFWSIEQPPAGGKKPLNFQDTYGMGHGKPKAHPVPKLEELLAKAQPEILVLQTGTNLFSLFQDGKTVLPSRHTPMLRGQIQPFLAKLLKMPHQPRAIYWVASPTSGRVSPEVQEFVLEQVRAQVGSMATIIDSRQLVSYPYKHPEPDHEHFIGEDMDHWADAVYALIQKDLATEGLPIALARPPGFEQKGPTAREGEKPIAPAPVPTIQVTAKLVSKSAPISADELNIYPNSLVAYLYEVEKVNAGDYTESQLLVMHPAHIGGKLQPDVSKLKIGKTYKLQLRELDGSLWSTTKRRDETGLISLLPYIRVEDEARFKVGER